MKEHRHPKDACQLRRQLRWNMSDATRLQIFDVAFDCEIILKVFLVFSGDRCFFSEMLCLRCYKLVRATCATTAARLSARNCNTLTFPSVSPSRVAVSRIERLRRKRQLSTSRYCSGRACSSRFTRSPVRLLLTTISFAGSTAAVP